MLELCPYCGDALSETSEHACTGGHAGLDLALAAERRSNVVVPPRVERAAPPNASFAAPAAVEGASLVWRFELVDGREVVADLDTRSTIETVRVAGRIVSRSAAGGSPGGHTFLIGGSGLQGDTNAYRAGAGPGEALVRFDPALRTCALTVDGVPVVPKAVPAPPISTGADAGHVPRAAQLERQPFPIMLVGIPAAVLGVVSVCFLVGKSGLVLLAALGALVAVAGNILMLVAAFSESAAWGVACLFVPGASFFFVVTHWDRAKRGFGAWLLGLGLLFAAGLGLARLGPREVAVRKAPPTNPEAMGGPTCPRGEATPSGFSRWCCTPAGWVVTDDETCTSSMKPIGACDASNVGTSTLEGCGTGGGRGPVRVRRR